MIGPPWIIPTLTNVILSDDRAFRGALARDDTVSVGSHVYNSTFLSRSEFVITETELKLMAAAAITGLNSKPKKG